jgi:hypothetical protein
MELILREFTKITWLPWLPSNINNKASQTHTKVHESLSSGSIDIYRPSVPKGINAFSSFTHTVSNGCH